MTQDCLIIICSWRFDRLRFAWIIFSGGTGGKNTQNNSIYQKLGRLIAFDLKEELTFTLTTLWWQESISLNHFKPMPGDQGHHVLRTWSQCFKSCWVGGNGSEESIFTRSRANKKRSARYLPSVRECAISESLCQKVIRTVQVVQVKSSLLYCKKQTCLHASICDLNIHTEWIYTVRRHTFVQKCPLWGVEYVFVYKHFIYPYSSIHLSICLCIYLSIYLYIHLPIYLSAYLITYLFIQLIYIVYNTIWSKIIIV